MPFLDFYVIQPHVLTLRTTAEPQGLVLTPPLDTANFRRLESLLSRCDISKQHSAEEEKPLNGAVLLPNLCSYSHLTAEQTMTGQGGIADTSPSMCENKSVQGWRPVCVFNNHGNFNGHTT